MDMTVFIFKILSLCVWVFWLQLYLVATCMPGLQDPEKGIKSPKTGVQTMVNCHVGIRNLTVIWKTSQCWASSAGPKWAWYNITLLLNMFMSFDELARAVLDSSPQWCEYRTVGQLKYPQAQTHSYELVHHSIPSSMTLWSYCYRSGQSYRSQTTGSPWLRATTGYQRSPSWDSRIDW